MLLYIRLRYITLQHITKKAIDIRQDRLTLQPASTELCTDPTGSVEVEVWSLPTDLTPFYCHSVLLIVHLLSFNRAMCPAHCHFVLDTNWTMSVTLVLCLMIGVTDSVF